MESKLKLSQQIKSEIDRNLQSHKQFLQIIETIKADKKVGELDESCTATFLQKIKPYKFNYEDLWYYIAELNINKKLTNSEYQFLQKIISDNADNKNYFCCDSMEILEPIYKVFLEVKEMTQEEVNDYLKANAPKNKYYSYIYRRAICKNHYFIIEE